MLGFSIIIVTWNGLHHLKRFLPSVVETNYPDFEIILADNNSSDESISWVKEYFPTVKIAALDDNYGYCGGNNRAFQIAEKEIVLFLNNDVEVPSDWLHGINQLFSEKEQCGAVQPKLLAYDRKTQFEYAGAAGGFLDILGYPLCRGRILDSSEEDHGQYDTSIPIFWASGAAFAIRASIFKTLNGFDEHFEFHMEEIDVCWRTQALGYDIWYTPESEVYHLGGGSLAMGSPRKVYYNFRNNLFMLWKNLPLNQLVWKFPVRFFLDTVAAWRSLLAGRPVEFWSILKAHLHFIRNIGYIQKQRSATKRTSHPKGVIPKSMVWNYMVRKQRTFDQLTEHGTV
ncbi:MAG: glycosyltransferase family 2 protein [Bacteroidota bacterium]